VLPLLCSSLHYQVTVLPGWLQPFTKLNPATLALNAIRATWIGEVGLAEVWPAMIRLLGTGALLVPIGVMIFQAGERYALRTGKFKRNGSGPFDAPRRKIESCFSLLCKTVWKWPRLTRR